MWGEGGGPAFQDHAKGARIWDADGHEMVDMLMGLGAVGLGHAWEPVDEAAFAAARRGICPSLSTRLEADLAEQLRSIIPCADMARFVKTGTEACMAAARIARAATGRETLLVCGYHGWSDFYAASKPRHEGVPTALESLTVAFPYNDLPALEGLFTAFRRMRRPAAAVMMEPTLYQPPGDGYLIEVRRLCSREGALLIFDEVVTGFRWANGGAQEHFGVAPDLATFGKAMANGWPLAAVVGRADLMRHAEFASSTFGAETASLAAALEVVRTYRAEPVVAHLWKVGGEFQDAATRLAAEAGVPFVCEGYAGKPRLRCTEEEPLRHRLLTSALVQRLALFGVLAHVSGQNISYSHSEGELAEISEALRATFQDIQASLADPRRLLVGEPYSDRYRELAEEGHGGPRV